MSELTLDILSAAVAGSAAGFRSITRLQPLDGPGGKIFPATYANGVYAVEKRRIVNGKGEETEVDCVLIDSVQAQSNRAELALKSVIERNKLSLPLIEVDFSGVANLRTPVENQTSLDVPHRLADAILRDSELPNGTRFSKSNYAKRWSRSNLWDATAVYEYCPTALMCGMWGSPDKPGGLGAKFERAYISEIVAIDVERVEKRFGFRIDPLGSSKNVGLKEKPDGSFEVGTGKTRPSELNHGNIPFDSTNAGIRCKYAEQATVVSLGALRKLRFPIEGKETSAINDAGRTVLAALALCAGVLSSEAGTSLRSRCQLVAESERVWELIDKPGAKPNAYRLNSDEAIALLDSAVKAAEAAGLIWMKEKLVLKPTKELAELVRQSQEAMAKEKGEGDAK